MLTKKLTDPNDFQMKNFNKMSISLYHDVGQISKILDKMNITLLAHTYLWLWLANKKVAGKMILVIFFIGMWTT